MSYTGADDQSEDGELKRSPLISGRKNERLDFSLSDEDADTADSLDIKPPQARLASRPSGRTGHKHSDRLRVELHGHRSRSERHRDVERTHSHRDVEKRHRDKHDLNRVARKYREKEYRERDVYREKDAYLMKEQYVRETREVRYADMGKYVEGHTRTVQQRDQRDDSRYMPESSREIRYSDSRMIYAEHEKRRAKDYIDREMKYLDHDSVQIVRREKKYYEHIDDLERGKPEPSRRKKEYELDDVDEKSAGDRALEDLRERLLDKRRHKENEEYARESRKRAKKDNSHQIEPGEILEDSKTYVKEVIDLSKGDEVKEKRERHHKRAEKQQQREEDEMTAKEREERELRREKLLEAEREIQRQKEKYRQELEARRERRERKRLTEEQNSESKDKKMEGDNAEMKMQKASALTDEITGIVTVSDNSEESDVEIEEQEVVSSERDEEDDDLSDHSGRTEETEESEESDRSSSRRSRRNSDRDSVKSEHFREQSPMSVGGLAKSDHSESRSRSISRSRSPRSDSHSRSRSRSRSASISLQKNDTANATRHPANKDKPEQNGETEDPKSPKEKKPEDNLPPYLPAVQGCRSVEEFQCLNRIEEGTYGVVYRARDKRTEEIVALKRLKMEKEKEGFPITSLREINTLLKGQHPNIVTVREIVVGSNMDKIFIVMDYVEHDLKSLMETMRHKKQVFVAPEVKCLLKQLLLAVAHLHDNWILHRDLKTSNLLLSHKGILKVGDFGLAREYGSPLKPYTPIVVTLWYRAPELLLCAKEYSTPIDIWSVGCIFAELLTMNALFPGKSEVDQLNRIFKDLGTPNEKIWPGYNRLPAVQKMTFTEYPVSQLRQRFGMLSELGLNLLGKFLTYDPTQRITAEDALTHPYFTEAPLPIDPAMFPTWPAKSELGHRKALAASPKPPSGGGQYKQLGDGDDDSALGFHMGGQSLIENRRMAAMGGGFSLRF